MKSMTKIMLILTPITFACERLLLAGAQRSDCAFDACYPMSKWYTLGVPGAVSVVTVLYGVLYDRQARRRKDVQ
jgi:hypothetical protein